VSFIIIWKGLEKPEKSKSGEKKIGEYLFPGATVYCTGGQTCHPGASLEPECWGGGRGETKGYLTKSKKPAGGGSQLLGGRFSSHV